MEMRTIDAAATSRVLTSATRLRAALHLSRTSHLEPPDLEGTLLACADDALRIRLTSLRWDGRGGPLPLHARLIDNPACYHFETRLLDPLPRAAPSMLRILRPEFLRVEERRTTHRRTFRHETEVLLWGVGDAQDKPCKAALLNLSAGGLACQVTSADERGFSVGTTVRLAFTPDVDNAGEITLAARIVSSTTAFLPDGVILGLEFDQESLPHAELARIEASLAVPGKGGERTL